MRREEKREWVVWYEPVTDLNQIPVGLFFGRWAELPFPSPSSTCKAVVSLILHTQ